jgi:Flp pilus assembly protein TadG
MRIVKNERGQALLEAAMTLPLLLLVSVSIFEFGRAYQTWQVLTNAAREGARVAVLPNATVDDVKARVTAYMKTGQLPQPNIDATKVAVDMAQTVDLGGGKTASASLVTVNYPFKFIVLHPVAQLFSQSTTMGNDITMTTLAEMRNESQ